MITIIKVIGSYFKKTNNMRKKGYYMFAKHIVLCLIYINYFKCFFLKKTFEIIKYYTQYVKVIGPTKLHV